MELAHLLAVLAYFLPLWCAFKVSSAQTPNRPAGERLLETVIGYVFLTQLSVLGLGITGQLNRTGFTIALFAIAALALIAIIFRAGAPLQQSSAVSGTTDPCVSLLSRSWPLLLQLIAAAYLTRPLLMWLSTTLISPMWLTVDDANYHTTISLAWLQQERFTILPIDIGASFPFGAELLTIWHMLPFNGKSVADMLAWARIPGASWIVMILLSCAVVAKSLGSEPRAWVVPALMLLSSPVLLFTNAHSFASVDNALPALVAAAFALSVALYTQGQTLAAREWYSRSMYIAAALGLAAGVKYTAIPIAAILVAGMTWIAWRVGGWRRAAVAALLTVGLGFVTGGYWYVRNWLYYDNPFYPAPLLQFPGHPWATDGKLVDYVRHFGWTKSIADIASVYLAWPQSLAWIAIAGLVLGPPLGVVAQKNERGRFALAGALTWAIVAVILAILPWQTWSAGNGESFQAGVINVASMRYVTIIPVLGWMWVGITIGLPQLSAAIRIVLGASVLAIVAFDQHELVGQHIHLRRQQMVWGATVVVLAVALWKHLAAGRKFAFTGSACWAGAFLAVCAVVATFHEQKRARTLNETLGRPYGVDARAELQLFNSLPKGRAMGTLGHHLLFGDHLQHQPIFYCNCNCEFVTVGERFDKSKPPGSPFDVEAKLRKQLDETDIVLYVVLPYEESRRHFKVVSEHPDFELLRQHGDCAVFARKQRSISGQPVSRHVIEP
jgi:hypothetical protein